nr:unnamed protein product [Callosobruchus chinensis]
MDMSDEYSETEEESNSISPKVPQNLRNMQKRSENVDLSLSIPQSNFQSNGYDMGDQRSSRCQMKHVEKHTGATKCSRKLKEELDQQRIITDVNIIELKGQYRVTGTRQSNEATKWTKESSIETKETTKELKETKPDERDYSRDDQVATKTKPRKGTTVETTETSTATKGLRRTKETLTETKETSTETKKSKMSSTETTKATDKIDRDDRDPVKD